MIKNKNDLHDFQLRYFCFEVLVVKTKYGWRTANKG